MGIKFVSVGVVVVIFFQLKLSEQLTTIPAGSKFSECVRFNTVQFK